MKTLDFNKIKKILTTRAVNDVTVGATGFCSSAAGFFRNHKSNTIRTIFFRVLQQQQQ